MLKAPRFFINESGDCDGSLIWLIFRLRKFNGSQSFCGVLHLTFECDLRYTGYDSKYQQLNDQKLTGNS